MTKRTLFCILAACLIGGLAFTGCTDADQESELSIEAPLLAADSPDAIPGEYIVVFKDSIGTQRISEAKDRVAILRDSSRVQHSYSVIPGFSATLSPSALSELRRNPDVAYIEQDQVVRLGANSNGQDRVDQDEGRDGAAYNDFGRNGSGVTAYVIDTGVNSGHSEFAGRYSHGRDTVDNDNNAEDCHGHGSHVAGTIGGSNYGLASGANIVGVRVLNCQGSGSNAGVVAGIDWVAANAQLPAVANMSLGGGASTATDNAVANLVSAGVFTAVAAGNSNTNACTSSPAREPSAYTVGATEDTSDNRASFSNYGDCVDGFAPGRNITSSWIGGSNATNSISGTSMATPHVAGAAAQYLGANPGASPSQVEAALDANAGTNCVGNSLSNEDYMLHVDFSRGQHDCGGGGGGPGDPNPNSCVENSACGGFAPGGCACDSLCWWYGDCCSDGPC